MTNVEQFQAPDTATALALVRGRFGPDAVILGSRTVRPTGLRRLVERPHVEVFAAPSPPPPAPPSIQEMAASRLEASGVGRSLAGRIAENLGGEASGWEARLRGAVERWLAPRLVRLGTGRCVMLVGPTGAGKTTTLAKIAARGALDESLKVGLITTDTTRIGAVSHLETYAEIMGLPWSVAEDAATLASAASVLGRSDRILVDTSGRNFRLKGARSEIAAFVDALHPDILLLVVALTSGMAEIAELRRHFEDIPLDAVILTKFDEAAQAGRLLDALDVLDLPLAAVTTGQTVPDDIWFPHPFALAGAVLEGTAS